MPEIAEAARIVHFLKTHLVGKNIKSASAIDDANVFGKAGTTGSAVAAAFSGNKVVGAGSQGKYFWLLLEHRPHVVMHFGMSGWIHIKGIRTGYTNYYNKLKADEVDMWPPKFSKFQLTTDGSPPVELAFTDPRRFGRVRLVDCPGDKIRNHSPLVDNGPDPVVDADTTFTEEYFVETLCRRHVPIKALLLDQAFISGIGNWVGDEVLFHARVHPEQYCDEFTDAQKKKVYASVRYVCRTAVDLLGDSDQFPKDWLFCHRWGKGSKNEVAKLPSGEPLAFATVGGRTSCYAPGLQKKTGSVPTTIEEKPLLVKETKPAKAAKGTKAAKSAKPEKASTPAKEETPVQKRKRAVKDVVKDDAEDEAKEDDTQPTAAPAVSTKTTAKTTGKATRKKAKTEPVEEKPVVETRRRSARLGLQ